ncbi:hypothetical protein CANINC_001920 [Pichia inconspicua]|uniref:Large ribosomal subunit protein uL4m n=1 Tax=Pichia inconspicua TaxID=52247 RepID=A0A4T0X301_9ASCO|nr:hypothetical protein CANINC_001920 [[Candida] inconspicua]
MFSLARTSLSKVNSLLVRGLATETTAFVNASKQPEYSISTLRSFPSLEPHAIFPIHNKLVNQPLRRDILWLATVMELDNRRVGASNPPGRSQHKFSRKKLFKQKGTGRARVGDANSPIRYRGAYALARQAPNDMSSDLPAKVYHYAYRIALSDAFRKGRLFVIGQDEEFAATYKEQTGSVSEVNDSDHFSLEIPTTELTAIGRFIKAHKLEKLNVLFIADDYFKVSNLREATLRYPSSKVKVMQKDEVEVRDLLKAHRIYIEKPALDYFAAKYTKFVF